MGSGLEGIRILDFGRYIAGPFCGMLLADMGAEVIRIEKIDGSEDRYTIPVGEGADGETSVGAMFLQMNRNKLGLTLNPMKPEGREIVRKLVATADVVIANLPAPTLKTMGLDYESLRAIKSDIILTAVSTFGSIGPYSDRVGFDGVAAAMCGMMHLTGNPNEPRKAYTPWVDYGTASGAAFGTLAALIHRDKTGEGQIVEGTLLGTALAFNNALLVEQAMIQPDRIGTVSASSSDSAGPVLRCSRWYRRRSRSCPPDRKRTRMSARLIPRDAQTRSSGSCVHRLRPRWLCRTHGPPSSSYPIPCWWCQASVPSDRIHFG